MQGNNFKIDVAKLPELQISVLRTMYVEGERHLKYFYNTMKLFKNPEKRIKCFDTVQYERTLPAIMDILREYDRLNNK